MSHILKYILPALCAAHILATDQIPDQLPSTHIEPQSIPAAKQATTNKDYSIGIEHYLAAITALFVPQLIAQNGWQLGQ